MEARNAPAVQKGVVFQKPIEVRMKSSCVCMQKKKKKENFKKRKYTRTQRLSWFRNYFYFHGSICLAIQVKKDDFSLGGSVG